MGSVKTEKLKIKLNKFLELISDDPKMLDDVTAGKKQQYSSSVISTEDSTTVVQSQTRPWSRPSCKFATAVQSPTRPRIRPSCFETK